MNIQRLLSAYAADAHPFLIFSTFVGLLVERKYLLYSVSDTAIYIYVAKVYRMDGCIAASQRALKVHYG